MKGHPSQINSPRFRAPVLRISRLFISTLLLLTLLGGQGFAAVCGDDVNGRDIPCACGDTVGSSVVLADDPVTETHCRRHALIVSLAPEAAGIEIDLNGRTLRGRGKGTGIWVTSGGRDGVRIVSNSAPALIEGFRDGIAGRTKNTISLVDNVVLSASARDGIHVFGDGVQVRDSEAYNSGRDGFSVRGEGWVLKDLRAFNSRRHGINASGEYGTVGVRRAGVSAESSGGTGINVGGVGHRIIDCVAIGGRSDGMSSSGAYHEITGCLVVDNDGIGMKGGASITRLQNNRAENNGLDGIVFPGHEMQDAGGNVGLGNGRLQTGPAKECEIGGVPCR
jgi:hypothetical protein